MEGARQSARDVGDDAAFSAMTRRLAEACLDGGDAGQACNLLQEVIDAHPDDVEARILRTKALVRISDRRQALSDIEQIAELLPSRCKRRVDGDAAQWCAAALLQIAPERADLIRRFRAMSTPPMTKRKRTLPVPSKSR